MWDVLAGPGRKSSALPITDRVHSDDPFAKGTLSLALLRFLSDYEYTPERELIVVCIGTDRSTGDSLGPLTGTLLVDKSAQGLQVYGTLDNPVHAANLTESMDAILRRHQSPFIVAVDACLGKAENVGYISVKPGPLRPGTGVNKSLPSVGDIHVVGVVNVGGFMEYLVLQNTRLSLVMKMAATIADALYDGLSRIPELSAGSRARDYSPMQPY